MSMETHSSLWSVPSKEGAELGITKHLSDDRLEVYIPKEAEVQSVRAQTLPPGMRKKMGLLSTARASDADHVTWISPVVVRERGPSPALPSDPLKAPPLSRSALACLTVASKAGSSSLSGWSRYWLPVVCSSLPAFKVLRKFMPNGNSQTPNLKRETHQPACASRGRPLRFSQDAIIIRQSQIFLSVKKSGPGRKRVEPSQTSLRESPSSLLQQGGVGVPRCPKDSQHSLDPSAVPPLKASQCPVSLRALCLQFGVERRACVTVAGLPDEVLKTLSAVGFVDLKNEPTATRLFCKDVRWWRSVCLLYPLLCLVALPGRPESVKARCGRELVADLEFVCGDRGFYRGKVSGGRNGGRMRGRGIVEQCCLKGCDLQHLEAYCAKPARSRRNVTNHMLPPTKEVLFQAILRKRMWALPRPVTPRAPSPTGSQEHRPQTRPTRRTNRRRSAGRTDHRDGETASTEQ
ncbi:hypothetical protein GJAV_G00183040 [Gymnothorax javanicus]|nr:hypothetical protein GJAV_G00183040 [Gymnothorax javanicus]